MIIISQWVMLGCFLFLSFFFIMADHFCSNYNILKFASIKDPEPLAFLWFLYRASKLISRPNAKAAFTFLDCGKECYVVNLQRNNVKMIMQTIFLKGNFKKTKKEKTHYRPVPSSCQLLQRSDWKRSDWKHHKLAQAMHSTAQHSTGQAEEGSTTGD